MEKLEVRDLQVQFPGNRALDRVSIEFAAGEVSLLAGPNGAGKSTLIRVLLGLVSPTQGAIYCDSKASTVDENYKKNLGYLPEMVSFSEALSGREVLRFFASARAVKSSQVGIWLARVGLEHAANRAVRTYSRGMRQRLGLAVACLADPSLIILDEPTGGLDQAGLRILWQLLAEFREQGRIVVVASHDLTAFEARVDKIALLRGGKLIACDRPAKLRERVSLPVLVEIDCDEEISSSEMISYLPEGAKLVASLTGAAKVCVLVDPAKLHLVAQLPSTMARRVRRMRVIEAGLDQVYDACMEAQS